MYWHIVGDKVTSVLLNFLNNGIFDHCNNFTHIALIPKVTNSINTSDFRPISLCNIIYILIFKVLAKKMKLKLILPHIIFKNQSTFMPRRLIIDNIIVAYEAFHSMKTRQKGCKDSMDVKLDISKAYDKMKWTFLKAMMS